MRTAGLTLAVCLCVRSALGAAAAAAPPPRAGDPERGAAVVALVNGKPITFGEVWRRVRRVLEEAHESPAPQEAFREFMREQLEREREDLIKRILLLHCAQEEGIKVGDAQIDLYADYDMEDRNLRGANLTSREDYWRAMEETYGFTEKEWREELGARVKIRHLYRRYVWKPEYVAPHVMRRYYMEHRADFQEGGFVTVRHVWFRRELKDFADAVREIEDAIAKGEPFAGIARRAVAAGRSPRFGRDGSGLYVYRDSGGAADRSAPGWKDHDGLLDDLQWPFPDVIRSLKVGQVCDPVRTPLGTHFFELVERSGGRTRSFAEVQGHIQRLLQEKIERAAETEYLDKLLDKADVRRFPFPGETPLGAL